MSIDSTSKAGQIGGMFKQRFKEPPPGAAAEGFSCVVRGNKEVRVASVPLSDH